MTGRCICEICTCGRHRCPHNPVNSLSQGAGPCKVTEYSNVYKPHPLPNTTSFKPQAVPMQGGEFQSATTMRDDFKKHPLERPYVHQQEQYVAPSGEMAKNTSYKQDYPEKHGPRAQAIRHEGQRQVNARFEGEPTYKSDYRQWDGAERTKPYGSVAAWQPPKDTFDHSTTAQRDYQSKPIPQRVSYKPDQDPKISSDPFPDNTEQREKFIPHALEKPFVRERPTYKAPATKFEGLTTCRRDYQGQLGAPTQSFKPLGRPFQSEQPFVGDTTFRNDYKGWKGERPYQHMPEPYHPPEGDMENTTTNRMTYKQMPIERVLAKRPPSTKKSDAPFQGETSYNTDFIAKRGERAVMPRGQEWVANPTPFVGDSTYQNHYKQHSQAPPQSFKPSNAVMQSDVKFADATSYRAEYVPKPIHVCEAAGLEQGSSRYRFAHLDNKGHKVYTTITPLHPRSPIHQNKGPMALSVA